MTTIAGGTRGEVPTFVATPSEAGPWPAVVIVHDAIGMTEDLRNQARWLAASGYLAAAPGRFHWGGRLRCLFRTMRDLGRGTQGPVFDDISAPPGIRNRPTPDSGERACLRTIATWSAAGVGLIAAGYVAYVALTCARYGRARPPSRDDEDRLLDRFMPAYDVVDRHRIRVDAPPAVTLAIACDMELFQLPVVRAIVRGRELILRAGPDDQPRPRGLLAEAQSLGWGVLAEVPGREIVVGAVTKPWEANVTFRSVPADEFATFAEPDYVKIVWTLRADPVDDWGAVFRTETRVMPTDATARAKFRRYWPFFLPGIKLIRRMALREVRSQATRRARNGLSSESIRDPSTGHQRRNHAR